jgi:HlyD family secretion protein
MLDLPKRGPTASNETAGTGPKRQQGSWAARHPGRLIFITLLVCVLFAAAGIGWNAFWRTLSVQAAGEETNVPVQVFGLGTVEARVSSQIGFKVGGVLVDLRADVGDRVHKGDVLARLDDREQTAQVSRAKAAVEQAGASLQRATASVAKAQANYANAKNVNERRQKLVETNIASVETAQSSQAAQDAAFADLNLANSDVSLARAAIDDAKAQMALQTATLDFHTLNAPYDALVVTRLKELGSALSAGQPVYSIIDPHTIWVLAYIDESKAGEIRIGEEAEIVLRSRPNRRLTGKVVRIEPESDRVNEERRVQVAFDSIPGDINLGEQAEVYITTVQLAEALLVPEASITDLTRTEGTVWTVEDGRLEQRRVNLGHRLLDGRFEITGGVPTGAKVVSVLGSGLRVGRAANVSDRPSS